MGKTQANRQLYIEILRSMTAEQRLLKAFELTDMVRRLNRAGIARRYPELPPVEIDRLALERVLAWHNKNS